VLSSTFKHFGFGGYYRRLNVLFFSFATLKSLAANLLTQKLGKGWPQGFLRQVNQARLQMAYQVF
jgi:hypothetical protein